MALTAGSSPSESHHQDTGDVAHVSYALAVNRSIARPAGSSAEHIVQKRVNSFLTIFCVVVSTFSSCNLNNGRNINETRVRWKTVRRRVFQSSLSDAARGS
ncbi:hypothetical protein AVEN_240088-1 [Araneus ventricosus]|uniref:Uncharacterized protein n=1 Tax=Araneus ventricosus TaxID=182803 RepID=A0A4Y2RM74_ARAVE|nr:hypothetical protein AVEN_240088-1 [Araneus ventricosus]